MRWPKPSAVWAATRFALVLGVLIVPWPGLGRTFAGGFSGVASVLLAPALMTTNDVSVHFHASADDDVAHEWSLMVQVNDAQTGAEIRHAAVSLRRSGYLQMIFYLALVAGWPGRSGRRLALVLGVGLVCLAALAALPILMFLAKRNIVHLGAWILSALAITYRTLVTAPGMAFAVPGFLWLLLARPLDEEALAFFKRAQAARGDG